jgi:ketosteroid isomerase-like protein
MPSANVELVRSISAAWERGDYSSAVWAHPEIEYVIADGPTPGEWAGRAGMAAGWRAFLSAWESASGTVEGYRELDNGRVLVLHSFRGRGKSSGLDIGQTPVRAATIFDLREGKVTRLLVYFDRHRALEDLGLGSEADSPRR